MINFPKPYYDELLYSILARARVHFCVVSPKRLIDHAMGTRTAISTINFPSRLNALSNINSLSLPSSDKLIYNHTLFPLYAPFLPEARRLRCLDLLSEKSFGSVHLISGYAGSRLPKLHHLRCCPKCYSAQLNNLGEPFWMRIHQVSGINYCPVHSIRLEWMHPYHSVSKRHEYIPLSILPITDIEPNYESELICFHWLTEQITSLLEREPNVSATYSQWTALYHQLTSESEMNKGDYAHYSQVKSAVLSVWPLSWLKAMNLFPDNSESCWLHCIIRKHRKSFSYLEHLVLIYALKRESGNIIDILECTKSIQLQPRSNHKCCMHTEDELRHHKLDWFKLVKVGGAKLARKVEGEAIYAWLYRHDKNWLLKINRRYKRAIPVVNKRVNWHKRDVQLIRVLVELRDLFLLDIEGPRRSRKWYLSHLETGTSVENYFNKLPLTTEFLRRYSEDVSDYQIRRLTRTIIHNRDLSIPRWILLRKAGLSDERMTKTAMLFLNSILSNKYW